MTNETASTQLVVWLVGGGIEALPTFVSTLPRDFPAPIVIAQHLDPKRPSHLGEILERRGRRRVDGARQRGVGSGRRLCHPFRSERGDRRRPHRAAVRRGCATQAIHQPALLQRGGGLRRGVDRGHPHRYRLGWRGGRAGGEKAGGTVVIQNPATATYPSMPQSLAPTAVDFVANMSDWPTALSIC